MKRLVAGLLWTLVVMWAGTYVTLYAELPAIVNLPFAVAIGAVVVIDPMGRIWPRAIERPAAPQETPRTATELVRSI
jgi:hypothetical protein